MIDFNSKSWINYIDEQVWNNLPASSLKSRTSSEITIRCPICGDSRKNKLKKRGYFYRKTGTYHCFNCDASMTGLSLLKVICSQETCDRIIQDYKVMNFDSIVRCGGTSSNHCCISDTPFEIRSPNPSYRLLMDNGWNRPVELSKDAIAYLDSRLIPSTGRDMLKTISNRSGQEFILIQYMYDGDVIYHQLANFKHHDVPGRGAVKYIFPREDSINFQEKPVFNLDGIDVSFPYIFCLEGIFDSLFVKNGVALGGKSLTNYQRKMLEFRYPHHKIVFAFDNDAAGIAASLKHADKFPNALFLNSYDLLNAANCKDINDFVKITGRTDIFMKKDMLKNLIMSPFMFKMRINLGRT